MALLFCIDLLPVHMEKMDLDPEFFVSRPEGLLMVDPSKFHKLTPRIPRDTLCGAQQSAEADFASGAGKSFDSTYVKDL